MKKRYILLLVIAIIFIAGLLFAVSCAADLQGKSKKALLYKVECLDYGKVNSISTSLPNVIDNVPGNVESIRFKPIVDLSSKVEVVPLEAETDIKYLGNLIWEIKIKDAAYNVFKIIVKSEEGKSNEYEFSVRTSLELKSFALLKNGTGKGDLMSDKSGVIGNDISVNLLNPTVKVDLSSDITNLTFKTKFVHTGKSVKISDAATPDTPSILLESEKTSVDFSTPVVRTLRIFSVDGTTKDYKIFVGVENTTIYTDEEIVNGVAVINDNTLAVLSLVDNSTDNVYITGGKNFVKSQWNDTNSYADDVAAILGAGGKPMYLAEGKFRGKYVKYYPVIKPSDSSLYLLNMVLLKTASPVGDANDIYQEGNAPYMNYSEYYFGKKYVSADFLLSSAKYIIAPPIYLRGRPTNLMWDALPKAILEDAVGDPDYNGKYSVMKTRTFTAVNDPGDYSVTDSNDNYISAGNWDWKIGEGVVPNKWLYFAFHFGRKNDNVVFSPAAAKTKKDVRKWYEVDAGESKPNWNNTFKVGKKYTWYIKDYLKGNQARIMIIEED